MKLGAFTMYDVKSESYYPPFYARTNGEALRQFGFILEDPQSIMSKAPGDFRLYRCGEFDPDSGVLTAQKEGIVLLEEGLKLIKEA